MAAHEKNGDKPQTNTSSPSYQDPQPFTITAQDQELSFFPAGGDRFHRVIDLIDSADETLRLCFYIFADDSAGRAVCKALVAAAERGVDVQLMVDGFGAAADENFFEPLRAAGGQFSLFSAKFGRRYLIRNHQKIMIADGKRAMIGGFNIEEDYFAPPEKNGWHDLGMVLEGSAVDDLVRWFDQLQEWVASPRAQFRAIRKKVENWDSGSGPVRLLIGGPTNGLSSWGRCVSQDLAHGRRLDMVMAYFSPSKSLMKRIGRIAAKGETRLVMAGKSDNTATLGATRSLYHYLLGRGARIWEFAPCKLHMKLIVLDDVTYIGSANFDVRSLYINLELMLRIDDAALAERLREFVGQHLPASQEITPAEHERNATLWNRIRWNAAWFLVTVMDYNVSRKLNLGL